MGRDLRPMAEGAIHHVMARGNLGRAIFTTDRDRVMFMVMLNRVCTRYDWRCLAYCLMGNHFHLALHTPKPNLSDGMRDLVGRYAWMYNHENGYRDHLFGRRFASVPIESDEQLVVVIRYIARNPRRGGLVESAEEWPWSSYPVLLGNAPAPGFFEPHRVMRIFGDDPDAARTTLRRIVEDDDLRGGRWSTAGKIAA